MVFNLHEPMSPDQVILINKPYRWTSFDVVKKVKNVLEKNLPAKDGKRERLKVGHAGTLDPLATGLLILCTGKMTKSISVIQNAEKEYTGSLMLGSTTTSYDLETPVSETKEFAHTTNEMIDEAVEKFTGRIMQMPPAHSAVKINGVRAYQKARKGEVVELEAREVWIKKFEITSVELPRVDFIVVCSKGTYIRSLANDFGIALGCGAYLSSLSRSRIGDYLLQDAMTMESFINLYSSETTFPQQIASNRLFYF